MHRRMEQPFHPMKNGPMVGNQTEILHMDRRHVFHSEDSTAKKRLTCGDHPSHGLLQDQIAGNSSVTEQGVSKKLQILVTLWCYFRCQMNPNNVFSSSISLTCDIFTIPFTHHQLELLQIDWNQTNGSYTKLDAFLLKSVQALHSVKLPWEKLESKLEKNVFPCSCNVRW